MIDSIVFKQVGGNDTRSRFYNLKIFDSIPFEIHRDEESITVNLNFADTLVNDSNIDLKTLYYKPDIQMQDKYGSYEVIASSLAHIKMQNNGAEKEYSVTVNG